MLSILTVMVYAVSGLTAALAIYYTVRDLSADLVLLGACLLLVLVWGAEFAALALTDLRGAAPTAPDRVVLYGYLVTGLVLPVGGGWLGLFERTRWGSCAIAISAVTLVVLQMRLPQIWSGGFA